MKAVCAVLLGLVAVVAAHYEGYPFVHKNEGRYGAKFPFANYRGMVKSAQPAYKGAGYADNLEFKYRKHNGYPVHVGHGQFYFLGHYGGNCDKSHSYGFYFTGDENSFIVCDNGKSHTFQCPKGTKNRGSKHFKFNTAYGMNDLCGVNTLH